MSRDSLRWCWRRAAATDRTRVSQRAGFRKRKQYTALPQSAFRRLGKRRGNAGDRHQKEPVDGKQKLLEPVFPQSCMV